MDSCFYTRSHYDDKRMGKLAASFLEYFPHAFSVAPSPQHSQSVKVFIFPMNILRVALCLVHRKVDYITDITFNFGERL